MVRAQMLDAVQIAFAQEEAFMVDMVMGVMSLEVLIVLIHLTASVHGMESIVCLTMDCLSAARLQARGLVRI